MARGGLCHATRAIRSAASILTVIGCATTSTSSTLLESSCPPTATYELGPSTSSMTAPWAHTWAARKHSRMCQAACTDPTCTIGCARGLALARPVIG
ncbi:hypothetical protein PR003_g10715 [Phytophthora rubi]|uniref:Uncharacterized protein n=1 Tax=Phytophthora rubi TaxID=129364 RepID=A0A6A3M964_9STRA|nr:hypothetical protein PR001_g13661 [Phytophthora rubi]KAE9024783.1 hypothetical protein PR002_g11371 [Phytophthora rubi]KAE9340033.1 hypothetical protein PR003_g10715 [Phytophthora rubi]